jgi:hypothetical protein
MEVTFPGGSYDLDQGERKLVITINLDSGLEVDRARGYIRVATLGFPGEEKLRGNDGHLTSWTGKLIVFRSLLPEDISTGERVVEILRKAMKYRIPPREEQMLAKLYEAIRNNPEPLLDYLEQFPKRESMQPPVDPIFGERKGDLSGG